MKSLVVFSHLRWDFVYQRPQQILSRLPRRMRVLFVEEPVFDAGDPRAELRAPHPGVTGMVPHTPLTAPGFHDDQIPLLSKLVTQALAHEGFDDYGAWLYTPMAVPLLQKTEPRIVVYDCMDELTAFKDAPRQLLQRENALMRIELASLPSTTVMTINVTQSVIDIVTRLSPGTDAAHREEARKRFARMWPHIVAFTLGAAAGAIVYALAQFAALLVPSALCVVLGALWQKSPPLSR